MVAICLAEIEDECDPTKLECMFSSLKKHLGFGGNADKINYVFHTRRILDAIKILEKKIKTSKA